MVKKYRVGLTGEEQEELRFSLVSKGRAAAYKQTHARILLLSDENQSGGPMMDFRRYPGPSRWAPPRWSGCAAGAWRRGLTRPWGAGSNCAAVRGSSMARVRPT